MRLYVCLPALHHNCKQASKCECVYVGVQGWWSRCVCVYVCVCMCVRVYTCEWVSEWVYVWELRACMYVPELSHLHGWYEFACGLSSLQWRHHWRHTCGVIFFLRCWRSRSGIWKNCVFNFCNQEISHSSWKH